MLDAGPRGVVVGALLATLVAAVVAGATEIVVALATVAGDEATLVTRNAVVVTLLAAVVGVVMLLAVDELRALTVMPVAMTSKMAPATSSPDHRRTPPSTCARRGAVHASLRRVGPDADFIVAVLPDDGSPGVGPSASAASVVVMTIGSLVSTIRPHHGHDVESVANTLPQSGQSVGCNGASAA